VVFEAKMRASTGREYPAEVCLQFFADEEPAMLLAMVHDTTERQRLAQAG
jgi:two-component system, chemotaxis family, CheB/CheR fusion protein